MNYYIPILKNRTVEIDTFKKLLDVGLYKNVIPLIEVIQEKTQQKNKHTFMEYLTRILSNSNSGKCMIDFVRTNLSTRTLDQVSEFINRISRDEDLYYKYIKSLKVMDNIIPVISFRKGYENDKALKQRISSIRTLFPSISFRVDVNVYDNVKDDIYSLISENDYFILDIHTSSHYNPVFTKNYLDIKKMKRDLKFLSILANSPKKVDLSHTHLENGEPIMEIDNSLRDSFSDNLHGKFDGFGDYAGISNDFPTKGGSMSPAGIYYSSENNYFIGYRRNRELSEFTKYIAPAIYKSEYWKQYSVDHHEICPGCNEIARIVKEKEKGNSQAKWKGISMQHYIYTINEWIQLQ